ncbi:MAG: hypothetical protein U9Q15_05205 [Patescibacteria group bacterium]|nr:hypothetical protein [Patescibacteria group bacterium]
MNKVLQVLRYPGRLIFAIVSGNGNYIFSDSNNIQLEKQTPKEEAPDDPIKHLLESIKKSRNTRERFFKSAKHRELAIRLIGLEIKNETDIAVNGNFENIIAQIQAQTIANSSFSHILILHCLDKIIDSIDKERGNFAQQLHSRQSLMRSQILQQEETMGQIPEEEDINSVLLNIEKENTPDQLEIRRLNKKLKKSIDRIQKIRHLYTTLDDIDDDEMNQAIYGGVIINSKFYDPSEKRIVNKA